MAATTMTVAAITAAVASTAGAVVQGVQNYQQGKFEEAEANINRAQALQSKKQAYQEESLNRTQQYRAGRHDLATGANTMAGMGMFGTSAETAYNEGAFNLAEDLSAMKYRYDAEAAKYGTQANMYGQHARMARHNRRLGLLASSLNVTGTAARGVLGVGMTQGWGAGGAAKSGAAGKTTFTGARTADGMYGTSGGWDGLSNKMPWRMTV